ncbi:hypothetical protein D1AOALGA4SA_6543 [Olavius algarvensis Delta 1 endosymbiont]|nr:hypothetical protein D1AOALGA4SA_6543 [Olavius algarvensis Delta 1 endosymbiont]
MKDKAVAFVVVRLSSSRFPAKQFRTIGDKQILRWITDRLRTCRELDEIVITTVAEIDNEPLREFAQREQLPCFWYEGEVDHVTTRLRKAAEAHKADICVLISGDCPLVYAPVVDQLIRHLRNDPDADVVNANSEIPGYAPAIEGVLAARKRAWQLADDLSDRPELKEHQFPVIKMHPDLFKRIKCSISKQLCAPYHRLSVDTWADLEFMNELHQELADRGLRFELPDALDVLKEKPELCQINSHVHQRKLVEGIKRVFFVVDAGRHFGYGHLMRSMELSLQLTERLGYSISFMVDDQGAKNLLEDRGFRVVWGGFERSATSSPDNAPKPDYDEIFSTHDWVIFDIYGQRHLHRGWRKKAKLNMPVMVLDNADQWAREADLIVIPGVTGPSDEYNENAAAHMPKPAGNSKIKKILKGREYIILRRDIRRVNSQDPTKDIDILAYLHSAEDRNVFNDFAFDNKLKTIVVEGLDPDFPKLLARTRLYVGNFGYRVDA